MELLGHTRYLPEMRYYYCLLPVSRQAGLGHR